MTDENTQFNILGLNLKLDPSESSEVNALDVINRFKKQVDTLRLNRAGLNDHEAAVLVGLNLMKEVIKQESEYKISLESLKDNISDAISFLDEAGHGTLTQ